MEETLTFKSLMTTFGKNGAPIFLFSYVVLFSVPVFVFLFTFTTMSIKGSEGHHEVGDKDPVSLGIDVGTSKEY